MNSIVIGLKLRIETNYRNYRLSKEIKYLLIALCYIIPLFIAVILSAFVGLISGVIRDYKQREALRRYERNQRRDIIQKAADESYGRKIGEQRFERVTKRNKQAQIRQAQAEKDFHDNYKYGVLRKIRR